MEENLDSIDGFLKKLVEEKGIELEELTPQSDEYAVRAMFSRLEDRYYLNCFIQDQVTEDELPGQLLSGQFTFSKTTLSDLCGKIEKSLDGYGIRYHSDVPVNPGSEYAHVSYKLEPRQIDRDSSKLIQLVARIVGALYIEHEKGH